jgi:hypothetical protein
MPLRLRGRAERYGHSFNRNKAHTTSLTLARNGRCEERRGRSQSSNGHEEPCLRAAGPSGPSRADGSCWSSSRSRR